LFFLFCQQRVLFAADGWLCGGIFLRGVQLTKLNLRETSLADNQQENKASRGVEPQFPFTVTPSSLQETGYRGSIERYQSPSDRVLSEGSAPTILGALLAMASVQLRSSWYSWTGYPC